MTTNVLTYDRPPVTIDLSNNRILVRASKAAACRRQLAYFARKYDQTNPPDNIAINRMLAGTLLEKVALDYLSRTQWTNVLSFADDLSENERPNLFIKLSDDIFITGNPDAVGSHPELTEGKQTLIEVKTRGNPAWSQLLKLGPLGAFPDAIAQLALYRKGMIDNQATLAKPYIHPQSTGVLVNMNTDTKEVRTYVASNTNLDSTLLQLTARLTPLANNLLKQHNPETLPERDYTKTDWQCKFCPFFEECYKDDENEEATPREQPPITRANAMTALHSYEQAQAASVVDRDLEKQKATAKETLFAYVKGEQTDQATLPGSTGLNRTLKLHVREQTFVDLEKLSTMLSPREYESVVKLNTIEYLRIS